jgi:hypothetical protein
MGVYDCKPQGINNVKLMEIRSHCYPMEIYISIWNRHLKTRLVLINQTPCHPSKDVADSPAEEWD